MRFSSLGRPACILALASFVFADSDVLKLTAENFEKEVKANPLMLVEFFAPWCGHCKALAPHYEEAATALKDKNIVLANVDCVDQADFCQANDVRGYPTLKVYKDGEPKEYGGPRQADGIISYMVKQSLPAVTSVTAENHEEFQKADKIVAIAYLSSPTAEPAPEFSSLAEKRRDDYLFGLVTDGAVAEAAGIKTPSLVLYRSFDEPRTEYPYPITSATSKDFEEWISELAIPTIDEVNGDNYQLYAQSGRPLAYLFLDPSTEEKDTKIAEVRAVSQKFKSKVNFVWIDAVKYGDHGKALNLPETKWPSFVIQDLQKQLKYPLDQSKEVTTENVGELVEKYVSGTLKPTLKSQAIPKTQGDVYELVGKNFEEVVFDDSKDVFVEFYATWCGHCKRLAPTWQTLGERAASLKDKLVVAKIDSPENDLPASVDFRIAGFPTLKFKPAGSRNFIDYEGDRSLESLIAFAEEHSKNNVVFPPPPAKEETQPETEPEQVPIKAKTEEASAEEAKHDEL